MTDEQQDEVIEGEVRALTATQTNAPTDYVPSFAITLEEAQKRLHDFKQFIAEQMVEGEDYGKIPGTSKPTLLKPGAEKLCNIFGLTPRFEELRSIEDWDRPLFYYVYRCVLTNKRTGIVEADCVGSCNSWEDRYRYRWAEHVCPKCNQATVYQSKNEEGGWFCWRKRGGCGAIFSSGDESIENQVAGKVENKDIFSLVNTIQKMSQKRALVGATLIATRASDSFTQDTEDLPSEALSVTPKGSKEEGNFITIGGKKYLADGKISQEWFDRLRQRIEEAGMASKHVGNHIKKHYNVERINDLTYAQALAFGKHLNEMIKQKPSAQEEPEEEEPTELTEEEAEPYAIPQDILDEAAEIEFDLEEFVAMHVSPDTVINESVQGLLRKVVQGLKAGGDAEALGENFKKQLAGLRRG